MARAEEVEEDGVTAADWLRELDEELLAGGPLLPSKLARPGPVRAPSPPTEIKKCVLDTPSSPLEKTLTHVHQ